MKRHIPAMLGPESSLDGSGPATKFSLSTLLGDFSGRFPKDLSDTFPCFELLLTDVGGSCSKLGRPAVRDCLSSRRGDLPMTATSARELRS